MENQKNPEDGATSGFEPNSSPLAVAPLGRTPTASVGSRFGKMRASFGSVRVVVFVVLGLLVIAGGAYAFQIGNSRQANKLSTQPSDNFGVQDIELKGLTDPNSLGLSTFQSLSINGQLRVNNSLIITPGSQPKQGTAGQIYYDKDGNFLSYYDGEQFLNIANSEDVANLQDQLDELFDNLSVSEESFLPEDIATLSDDNVFSGFNVFEGGLEGSDLTVTGAAILQGDLAVDGMTDLTDLNVSGTTALGPTTASSLVLSSPLDVSSGGTGASSFTSNGILIGQGSSPLATVNAAGAGLCLISTAGAPSFQACPGGGGAVVDSLNGLTGNLSIANASGSGTTITINDATTAAKGIASFNATNFSVSTGAVNTIQNIAVTSAPTFAGLTLNGNLSVGGNSIVTSGATISSVELDVLDGGVTEGEVTGVITDVTAGNGLTGGAASGDATVNIASANGAIVVNADNIALTLQPSGDGLSASTSSGSGLEVLTGGLSLLQGCSDGQILKWNETSDTWGCSADAGGSGVGDDLLVNGLNADGANFINTVASGSSAGLTWNLNTTPSPDDISVTVTNASATQAGVVTTGVQSFAGDKTYNNALTVTGLFAANGGVTVEAGDTFTFNGDAFTDLTGTGLQVVGGILQASLGIAIDSSEITDLTIVGADIANDTITDTQLAFNTGQHLTVTSTPTFASLIVTGGTTASRPGSPTEGQVYFDTDTDKLLVYSNGKWQADRTSVTKTVAPSNAPQHIKDSADYVADGTGDQVEINAALTAAAGGKVYLFEGTFVANATILVPNNTTLSGAGRGTLIELADLDATDNLIENSDTTTGTGVRIQDLRIDGRSDLNTAGFQHGIAFNGMGALGRQGGTINGVIANNFRNFGIYVVSSVGSIITGTHTQANAGAGIGLDTTADNSTLTGNTAQGNFHGISVGSAGNTITGNTVVGNTGVGINVSFGDNNTITGNTISGNSIYGVILIGIANGNLVSGNRIIDNGGATTNNGIYIDGSDNSSITGNYISDTSGTTTNYAINVFNATSDNTYIANNNIDGGSINNAGTGTVYGGQVNGSGNFVIQPAGTVELMKDTNVTGNLGLQGAFSISATAAPGAAPSDQARFYYDATSDTIKLSLNGGGYNDLCTTATCGAGTGGGVTTPGGTSGNIAKFTGSGTIDDSTLSEAGSTLTASGNLVIQGANSLALGTSSSLDGSIAFRTAAGANTVTLQAPIANPASNLVFRLPSAYGNNGDCLQSNGSGELTFTTCTGGVGGGVTSIDGQTGVVTVNNATGNAGVITIDDATTTTKGIASFSASNFSVTSGAVSIAAGGVGSTELATDAVTTLKITDANVTNAKLQNSSLSVTAGAGLTDGGSVALGGATTLNIASANGGIVVNSDNIALTLQPAGDALSATTSSGSGLEILSGGFALLQGCGDGEVLKWSETTDTWGCAADAGGSGLGDDVSINGAAATNANFINTVASGSSAGVAWALNTTPSPDEVSITISNASATEAGVVTTGAQSFAGVKTFGGQIAANGGIDLGAQTLQGTTSTIDFTNFDVLSNGNTTVGGTLTVTGATALNDNVTVAAGKSLTLTGGNTGSRPGSPTEGMVYFDTDTDKLLVYSNGKWQADRTSVTKTVAPSNAPQHIRDSADYVADGTADEVEINQALSSAAGGKVYLFEGTFTTADTISIPNNTTLSGAGKGTLIQFGNLGGVSKNMITNTTTGGNGTGITIRDLKLDGDKTTNGTDTVTGIYLNGMGSVTTNLPGATITNVAIQNFENNGIHLATVANNIITDNTIQFNDDHGILTNDSNHDIITNNIITDNTLNGIYFNSTARDLVSGNIIRSNGNHGIRIESGNTNTITDNILRSNTGSGSTSSVYLVNTDTNLITNNNITDSAGTGYAIDISDTGSDANYLSNNTYSGTGASSINDASGGDTVYGGQVNGSGNFLLQPTGTIELMKSTNIAGNLGIGANSIVTSGATISSAELDVLDGGIAEGEVTGVITDVTAGNGLGGGGASGNATLNITSANGGIVVNADDIALTLQPSANGLSGTTSSGSGLEILTGGLSLLQGCADGEVLKWNETTDVWACAVDAGGSGLGDDLSVNGSGATNANFIDTVASGSVAGTAWGINTTPSPDEITLTVSNASATVAGVVTTGTQTFAGDKTFNNAVTIASNLTIGSNSIITSGATISSAELDVLDDGISENEVTGVITDVSAGSGLTGGAASGNASVNVASGNGGIVVNADNIALTLQPAGDGLSATTSSGSGLEIMSGGLSLLQGCGDAQILKWNETTDTWGCGDDAGGAGLGDDVSVNGASATHANFINTTASGTTAGVTWSLNTTPSPDEVSLTVSNASATVAGVVTTGTQTFAGDKTYNNAVTIQGNTVLGSDVADTLAVNAVSTFNENITVATGKTLRLVGDTTANRPTCSGTDGRLFYDTDTDQLLVCANNKWQADRSDAILVAASNSSQANKDAADYVADGNGGGALDGDQVQINAALTAATGKKVVLLAGTYVADGTILMPNSTTLAGVGMGTLIELDLDASDNLIENIDSANGTGITIRDMKIDGRKDQNSAGTQRGIHLTGMGGGTGSTARLGAQIINMFVTSFRSENVLLTSSAHNTISDSTFQAATAEGLQFSTSSNNVVTGSKFQGNGASGFNANSSSNTNTLTGNNAQGNSSAGFSLASGSYSTLSGNTSQGNGYGFFVTTSSNTITGNTAQGNSSAAVYASGANNTISGNTAIGGTYGIHIGGDSNDVTGNTTQGTTYGIYVNANHTTVSGNNVSTATLAGINLNAANSSTISGNRVYDSGGASTNNGISLTNSDSNTLADNVVSDTSATTNNYAIAINNTSTTNYLSGNTLGTGSINDLEVGNTNVYGGQVDVSGNFDIQSAGVISLLDNTEITGTLNVTSDVDTNGSLTVGNANQFVINNTGVVTSGTWQGSTIALAYGGTNNTTYTTNGIVYSNGSALVSTAAGTNGQCLLATTGSAPTWGACTATNLQGTYDASSPATIDLSNSKDFTINATEQTVDSSIVFNLQCTTCSAGGGRFAIQDAGVDIFTVNPNGDIIIGTATNNMTLTASNGYKPVLNGTARNSKKIRLHAEYPSVVLTPDGSNNLGTLTSGYDNASSARMNYYNWTTTQGTNQDYDVVVQVPLPSDFNGWDGANPLAVTAYTSNTTNGTISLEARDSADAQICNFVSVTPGSASTWTTNNTACTLSTGTYTAGDYITLRIRLQAPTSGNTRVGNITLNYLSKF